MQALKSYTHPRSHVWKLAVQIFSDGNHVVRRSPIVLNRYARRVVGKLIRKKIPYRPFVSVSINSPVVKN